MKRKISILVFTIISCFFKTQQVSSIWYDTDNGLPQNSVKDIIKDKYGFIWISSENGIVMYDGNKFKIQKKLALHNNRFSDFYGQKGLDSIFNVSSYSEDKVIITKINVKIDYKYYLSNVSFVINNKSYLPYHKNSTLSKSNGNLFIKIGTNIFLLEDGNIKSINKGRKKKLIINNLENEYKDKIFCDRNSIYTISNKNKQIIKITNNAIDYLKGENLFFHKNSKIYWSQVNEQSLLINKKTLYEIICNKNSIKLKKIIDYDFEKESVASIYYDKEYNSVYIGTISRGLNIIKKNNFTIVKKSDSPENSVYYAQTPINNTTIITSNGETYNENGFISTLFKGANDNKYLIHIDNHKNIYIKSDVGLELFNEKQGYKIKHTLIKDSNITNFHINENISCIATMKEYGKEYFLQFYNPSNLKKLSKKYLFKSYINIIKEKDLDELLVGTSDGLYIVNKKNVRKINFKKNIQVREIVKTKDKNIWIFTYGDGFYLLKNNNLIKMPIDEKERLLTAHSLQESQDDFWISTNDGLFKVNKKNLLTYANLRKTLVYYYRYSKEDGLKTNEFNGGCSPSSSQLKNGQFVFPSMNGLVFFNPDKVKSYYPKNFYINTIEFYDKKSKIDASGTIVLENDYYKTEIYVDIPYYANNENLVIESKIENSNNETWERVSFERKILINGLPPGNYILKIRTLKSAKGDFIYKKFKIRIKYLFYQTLAFKLLLAIAIVLLILLFIKHRIKKQQLRNIELEKIIDIRTKELNETLKSEEKIKKHLKTEIIQQNRLLQTISHDVITPAKYMAITTKKLYEIDEKDYTKYRKYFEALYKSSQEFYNFIITLKEYAEIYRNINRENNIKYNLNEIIRSKKLLFKEIAKEKNTTITFAPKEEIYFSSNRNIIGIILHNLIDNSVKNTHNGEINIDLTQNKNFIIIQIRDNGSGMSKEQINYYINLQKNMDEEKLILQKNMDEEKLILQKYGLGLHLVLQLLQLINGELELKNNIPIGTIAIIKIKK